MSTVPDKLLQHEGNWIEWKRGVADVHDVVRTLVAFANDLSGHAEGGYVVCGVEEQRADGGSSRAAVVGLAAERLRELQGRVPALCRDRVHPPLFPFVATYDTDDPTRKVLTFHVTASPSAHAYRDDVRETHWIRSGSNTVEARGEALQTLLRQKGRLPPFLDLPCHDASVEELDPFAVEDFFRRAALPQPAQAYLQPGAVIDATSSPLVLRVPAGPGETRAVPSNLAVLLFGRDPARHLRGASVVLSRYDGTDRTAHHVERAMSAGPLPKLLDDLLSALQLDLGIQIDKSQSATEHTQNRPRYSAKAVQEAVVNAFAHRDYASPEPVRVTVFRDRIEVASPGGLLPGADAEKVRRGESFAEWRNPGLASFLLRLGFAQREGQGIPTILRETLQMAGVAPMIDVDARSFRVTIPAFRPRRTTPTASATPVGGDALVLVSVGGESLRAVVSHSLPALGLEGAVVACDLVIPGYVEQGQWTVEARTIRDAVRGLVDDPRYGRFHLFYRGPNVFAPLLGAIIAPAKPLVLYQYENGVYQRAVSLERSFLLGKD